MMTRASRWQLVSVFLLFGFVGVASADPAAAQPEPRLDVSRAGLSFEWTQRAQMPHGIAGAQDLIFITEPLNGRVVALDRLTGA